LTHSRKMPVRKQSYLYLRSMPDDSYRVTHGNYFTMDVRKLEIETWRLEFARTICNIKSNLDHALGLIVIQELRLLLLNIELFLQYYFLINQMCVFKIICSMYSVCIIYIYIYIYVFSFKL